MGASLSQLELSSCGLSGPLPVLPPSLKRLDLSNNQFSGDIASWDGSSIEVRLSPQLLPFQQHSSPTVKHDSAMVWLLTASSVAALLCCAAVRLDAMVAVAVADGDGGAGYDDDAMPREPYAFVGSWPMPTACGIVVAAAGVIP